MCSHECVFLLQLDTTLLLSLLLLAKLWFAENLVLLKYFRLEIWYLAEKPPSGSLWYKNELEINSHGNYLFMPVFCYVLRDEFSF